ncbi:MAG: glycosyltransferase [Planctomycetia bacterium]|nr:MAG: glycosyltransferase [Planctomycetia bacterium]
MSVPASLRIALVVTDLAPGGTPLRIARLARGLRRLGQRVAVIGMGARGPVADSLRDQGIPVFTADARNPRDFCAVLRLCAIVRAFRPQIVHATLTHANLAARAAGVLCGVPVVTATATIEVERRWHAWAERLTRQLDRAHLVNSAAVAAHTARAFGRSPRRVLNLGPAPSGEAAARVGDPVERARLRREARASLDISDHEFVVLWTGRFDPVKRVELAIRAVESLSDRPSRLLLAGDGASRPDVERELRLSSAAARTQLLGWQPDLAPLYAAADALLLTSRTEGMPNAVLEAMAAGLPIVATDIPPIREVCRDGLEGLLVPDERSGGFAAALRRLCDEPDLRRRLGNSGAARAAAWLDPLHAARMALAAYRAALAPPAEVI